MARELFACARRGALRVAGPGRARSATTSPLRCSMPRNCCSSSSVIFCGGNSASKRSLISSRLVCAVEHLQDRVLFLLEAEVVQADRILHDPVAAAQIMLLRDQVRPPADGQHPGGTGQQTVVKGNHEPGRNDE